MTTDDGTDIPGITEEERQEADALAVALERAHFQGAPIEDALEAAALIRYSRADGSNLSDARSEAILSELPTRVSPATANPTPGFWDGLRGWLVPAAGLAVAAAVAILFVLNPGDVTPRPGTSQARATVPEALVRAQLELATSPTHAAAAERLRAEMQAYRTQFFSELTRRYSE